MLILKSQRYKVGKVVTFLKFLLKFGSNSNRFKVNKKNINKLRLNLKYFWENWFQNCFFNKTGLKIEPI